MFLTSAHASASLAPRREPRYPVAKRLGWQQSRSGPQSPFVTFVELKTDRNYFSMRYELWDLVDEMESVYCAVRSKPVIMYYAV